MTKLAIDSLVLYKGQAGRVVSLGAKRIKVELAGNNTVNVRPKDVIIHSKMEKRFSTPFYITIYGGIEILPFLIFQYNWASNNDKRAQQPTILSSKAK